MIFIFVFIDFLPFFSQLLNMIIDNFERCKDDDDENLIEDTTGLKKHGTDLMVDFSIEIPNVNVFLISFFFSMIRRVGNIWKLR